MRWHQGDRGMIPMFGNQGIFEFNATLNICLWNNLIPRRYCPGRSIVYKGSLSLNNAVWYGPKLSIRSCYLRRLSVAVDQHLLDSWQLYVFGLIHQLKDALWQDYYVTALVLVRQLEALMLQVGIDVLHDELTWGCHCIEHQAVTRLLIQLTLTTTRRAKQLISRRVRPRPTSTLSCHGPSTSLRSCLSTSNLFGARGSHLQPILGLKSRLWVANWRRHT